MNNKPLFSHKTKEPVSGFLYIVGTILWNFKSYLKNVSLIACEILDKQKILNNLSFQIILLVLIKIIFLKIPECEQ